MFRITLLFTVFFTLSFPQNNDSNSSNETETLNSARAILEDGSILLINKNNDALDYLGSIVIYKENDHKSAKYEQILKYDELRKVKPELKDELIFYDMITKKIASGISLFGLIKLSQDKDYLVEVIVKDVYKYKINNPFLEEEIKPIHKKILDYYVKKFPNHNIDLIVSVGLRTLTYKKYEKNEIKAGFNYNTGSGSNNNYTAEKKFLLKKAYNMQTFNLRSVYDNGNTKDLKNNKSIVIENLEKINSLTKYPN